MTILECEIYDEDRIQLEKEIGLLCSRIVNQSTYITELKEKIYKIHEYIFMSDRTSKTKYEEECERQSARRKVLKPIVIPSDMDHLYDDIIGNWISKTYFYG